MPFQNLAYQSVSHGRQVFSFKEDTRWWKDVLSFFPTTPSQKLGHDEALIGE